MRRPKLLSAGSLLICAAPAFLWFPCRLFDPLFCRHSLLSPLIPMITCEQALYTLPLLFLLLNLAILQQLK